MTQSLSFHVHGADADAAAPKVAAAVKEAFGAPATVHRPTGPVAGPRRDLATGLAVATLLVTLPCSAVAVADLIERRRRRDQADRLIERLRDLSEGRSVSIRLEVSDRTIAVQDLTPDDILRAADRANDRSSGTR